MIMPDDNQEKKDMSNGVLLTPITLMNLPGTIEDISSEHKMTPPPPEVKQSKWKIVKESHKRFLPEISKGEIQLNNLIDELTKFPTVDHIEPQKKLSIRNSSDCITLSKQRIQQYFQLPAFHYCIIALVIIDLMVVLVDLIIAQLSSPCLTDDEMDYYNTTVQRDTCLLPYSVHLSRGEQFLFYFSVLLLVVFVLEVFFSFFAFGWRHFKNPLYLLDGLIVVASFVMEIYFHYGNIGRAGRAAAAVVVLRLWKIVRAIHAVAHSISLKNRLLIKKIQEAQFLIEEEKENTEKLLEKQDIKVEYLMHILKTLNKLPTSLQIEKYVEKTYQQRTKTK